MLGCCLAKAPMMPLAMSMSDTSAHTDTESVTALPGAWAAAEALLDVAAALTLVWLLVVADAAADAVVVVAADVAALLDAVAVALPPHADNTTPATATMVVVLATKN